MSDHHSSKWGGGGGGGGGEGCAGQHATGSSRASWCLVGWAEMKRLGWSAAS
jgi:hypothetical protein